MPTLLRLTPLRINKRNFNTTLYKITVKSTSKMAITPLQESFSCCQQHKNDSQLMLFIGNSASTDSPAPSLFPSCQSPKARSSYYSLCVDYLLLLLLHCRARIQKGTLENRRALCSHYLILIITVLTGCLHHFTIGRSSLFMFNLSISRSDNSSCRGMMIRNHTPLVLIL